MADEKSAAQALDAPADVTQPLLVGEAPVEKTSASRRVRARLARRMTAQRSTLNPVLEPLVAVHREIYPKADLSMLQRAFEVADQRHATQLRHSGDPYITHPLAVANILAELGMDTTTLVAAAVAGRLGTGVLAIRKSGKLPPPVHAERYALEYGTATLEIPADGIDLRGRDVVIIDDVLATGGTLGAAARLLQRAGAHVSAAAVVMELTALGGREAIARLPVISLSSA